ncbi:MAG: hypothetical protein ACI83P_001986, partial [Janthinobacterium sp.]
CAFHCRGAHVALPNIVFMSGQIGRFITIVVYDSAATFME